MAQRSRTQKEEAGRTHPGDVKLSKQACIFAVLWLISNHKKYGPRLCKNIPKTFHMLLKAEGNCYEQIHTNSCAKSNTSRIKKEQET